jgi:hypothetical protein
MNAPYNTATNVFMGELCDKVGVILPASLAQASSTMTPTTTVTPSPIPTTLITTSDTAGNNHRHRTCLEWRDGHGDVLRHDALQDHTYNKQCSHDRCANYDRTFRPTLGITDRNSITASRSK